VAFHGTLGFRKVKISIPQENSITIYA
jgi:hypothetical protein